ncbi:MAG: hypothetical protein IJD97_04650 [Clostridia bacterium]|nr:hypothetical protein [Clostridia bacterium]
MEIIFPIFILVICCIPIYRAIRDAAWSKAINECVANYYNSGHEVVLKKRDARLNGVFASIPQSKVSEIEGDGYLIMFRDATAKEVRLVRKITLNADLAEKAKKSEISKYMIGNSIIVIEEVELSNSSIKALQDGDVKRAGYLHLYEARKGYPSYTKCQEIISWISGEG